MTDVRAEAHCPNCGAPAESAYCPDCGQAQREYHRPLGTLAGEALDAFAGWDGKLPATFRLLLARPGALTAEFLAGRRARYVPPLRLYLTASVLALLALRTPAPGSEGVVRVWHGPHETGYGNRTVRAHETLRPGDWTYLQIRWIGGGLGLSSDNVPAPPPGDNPLHARVQRGLRARFLELRAQTSTAATASLRASFFSYVGTTLFLLVPLLALLCMLLWGRARLFYAEHLVFALHAQAQLMLAVALVHFAPGPLGFVPLAWAVVYFFVAVRRVYGRGREGAPLTLAKTATLVGVYTLAASAGMIGTLLVAMLAKG